MVRESMVKKSMANMTKANIWTSVVVVLRTTWRTSQPKSKKPEKIHPEKNSLYFRRWNFLALVLKKFYISGNEPLHFMFSTLKLFPKKISHIFSEKKNRSEKISYAFIYFWKWISAFFSPSSKNKRNQPRENFIIFHKTKTLQKISYILGGNLQNLKIKNFFYQEEKFSKLKYFLVLMM